MKILPTKKYQYPFYMTFYWLFIWIIVSFVLYVRVIETSNNGLILKRDCTRKVNNVCTLSSRKYAVPFGLEAGSQIVTAGIVIGFFVLVGGFSQMIVRKK